MSQEQLPKDEIFPKGSGKSYALVEMMEGDGPSVGKGPENTVFSFPVVLLWELILTLGVTLAIFLFSLLKQAPLEEIANPLVTTDPAKAPWYFVGLQELLEHMHPTLAGVIIPGLLVGFLILIPYLDFSRLNAGVWFSSRRGKCITIWASIYTAIIMPAYIFLDNAISLREQLRGIYPDWVAQGLIPALIMGLFVLLPMLVLRIKKVSRREYLLALFSVMFTAAIVFTLSGFLFRGPGFKLYFPWDMPSGYNPWSSF